MPRRLKCRLPCCRRIVRGRLQRYYFTLFSACHNSTPANKLRACLAPARHPSQLVVGSGCNYPFKIYACACEGMHLLLFYVLRKDFFPCTEQPDFIDIAASKLRESGVRFAQFAFPWTTTRLGNRIFFNNLHQHGARSAARGTVKCYLFIY